MKTKSPNPSGLDLHFDRGSGAYWLRLNSGEFLPLDTGQAKLHLRAAGLSLDSYVEGLNEVERALWVAQKERHVHYAGPLAGYLTGSFSTDDGRRVLVTSSARRVAPKKGDADWFETFFRQLLGEQAQHFLNWLALRVRALEFGSGAPGQVACLAGPSGCGKSLCQDIVTACLGGREAGPYDYMVGNTEFNSDLAEAEHWKIEDKACSTDIRKRRAFGGAIKEACYTRHLRVRGLHCKPVLLMTYRTLTVSVNDETENLMILPPLDESLVDKINLYHCEPADVGSDRAKTWAKVTAQLPAFLFELAKLQPEKQWRCPRSGQKSFHHPKLLEVLTAASPESRLLSLVDQTVFADGTSPVWTGTAEELEKTLRASPFGFAVEKLLYFSSASGVYLARLAGKLPERVTSTKKGGRTVWTLVKEKEAE